MKIGNKILYIFTSCIFAIPNELVDLYDSGVLFHKESNYKLAIHNFESIIEKGWYSEELLYNLGNSYHKDFDIPNAIWSYEQTLAINPRNNNALLNLNIIKSSIGNLSNLPEHSKYTRFYFYLVKLYSSSDWLKILLSFILILSIMNSIKKTIFLKKKFNLIVKLVLVYFFIFILWFSCHSIYLDYSINEAIIINDSIKLRVEPNIQSEIISNLDKGSKISINKLSDNWIEVTLSNDTQSGWIEKKNIRRLNLNKGFARF